MSDAEHMIKRCFKELVLERPYAKITVSDICERAHLSRKSFYAHFDNKEAILADIIHQDVIQPLQTINDLFSLEQAFEMSTVIFGKIYEQIYGQGEFYETLVKPMKGVDDTFIRILTHAIYELDIELLHRYRFAGDARKADYVAYFFASSQAMLIQKWIGDGMPYAPQELADLYRELTGNFWLSTFSV